MERLTRRRRDPAGEATYDRATMTVVLLLAAAIAGLSLSGSV
jgi:hypothetical protein